MQNAFRISLACTALVASVAARGEPKTDIAFAAVADSKDGNNFDADGSFAPNSDWALGAGVGHSKSPPDFGGVDGTSLRASADWHSDQFGVRGYYRHWSDSSDFRSDTGGLRLSTHASGFEFSLIGEERGFEVPYTQNSPTGPTQQTAHFDATGFGAGASYYQRGSGGYVEGVYYDYDARFDQYRTAAADSASAGTAPSSGGLLPGLPVPAIPVLGIPLASVAPLAGLTGSAVTLNEAPLRHQLGAGAQLGIQRSTLRVDWIGASAAVNGNETNVFSAGYRYAFTQAINGGLTVGVAHSDLGSVSFAGVNVGLHF